MAGSRIVVIWYVKFSDFYSVNLNIYIYKILPIYVCVYIHIYIEREREVKVRSNRVKLDIDLRADIMLIQFTVCITGDARRRTALEVLPKAVSQSRRLFQKQHPVLWAWLLLSYLCTSVLISRLLESNFILFWSVAKSCNICVYLGPCIRASQ